MFRVAVAVTLFAAPAVFAQDPLSPKDRDALLRAFRVVDVQPGGLFVDRSGRPQPPAFQPSAPLPVQAQRRQLVLTFNETVVLRAPEGKKFKSVAVDQAGVLQLQAVDPTLVKVTGVGTGTAHISVETE